MTEDAEALGCLTEMQRCRTIVETEILRFGHMILGWRQVPVDISVIGEKANATRPEIEQILIGRGDPRLDNREFEKQLYILRRRIEKALLPLAEKLPGSRILDGRFMAVQQSVAIPKGREAGFAYLRAYVDACTDDIADDDEIHRHLARPVHAVKPRIRELVILRVGALLPQHVRHDCLRRDAVGQIEAGDDGDAAGQVEAIANAGIRRIVTFALAGKYVLFDFWARSLRDCREALFEGTKHLHSLDLARSYCDRLIGMAAGHVAA